MLPIIAFASLVSSPVAAPTAADEWQSWTLSYSKTYSTDAERAMRYKNWLDSREFVVAHNARDDTSWSAKLNEFADLSWDEFREGHLMTPQNCSATHTSSGWKATAAVPDSIDWREKIPGWTVKSQVRPPTQHAPSTMCDRHAKGRLSLSHSISISAAPRDTAAAAGRFRLRAQWKPTTSCAMQLSRTCLSSRFVERGARVPSLTSCFVCSCLPWLVTATSKLSAVLSLSLCPSHNVATQLVDCAGGFNNFGCNGGLPSQAFEYLKYAGGHDTEDVYPYTAKDGKCSFDGRGVAHVTQINNITAYDEDELMQAVGSAGPVSIAFQVAKDFRFYDKGVYDGVCDSAPSSVNHAVVAVGYGRTKSVLPWKGQEYFIVRNSWGASWGVDGYFLIKRGVNKCGLADCASFPTVA